MKEIERHIYVDDEIFRDEYEFVYGTKSNIRCYVEYRHIKTDRCSCHISGTYRECLIFARKRTSDGRYKNYDLLIDIE